jgi:beta-galactosidase
MLHGLAAFNFYMIVERELWYGSPVGRRGDVRTERFDFYRRLLSTIEETNLPALERVVQVAVCQVRDYDRLEKASTLFSPLPPLVFESKMTAEMLCDERRFGFGRCIQIEHEGQARHWRGLLDRMRVPHDLTDTDAEPAILDRYRLLVAPTFEFASAAAQEALVRYAEDGGTLVIGPDVPELDERMAPLSVLGEFTKKPVAKLSDSPTAVLFEIGRGRIVLLDQALPRGAAGTPHPAEGLLDRLLDLAAVEIPQMSPDPDIECATFRGDGREIVLAANPGSERRVVDVSGWGARRLVDLWTGETFHLSGQEALAFGPYTVRVLELKR